MPKLIKKRVEEEKKPKKKEKPEQKAAKPEKHAKKETKLGKKEALPSGDIYTVLAEYESRWHTIILVAESEKEAKKKAKAVAIPDSTVVYVAKGYKYTVIDTSEDARKLMMSTTVQ